jgi:hypothetical protein
VTSTASLIDKPTILQDAHDALKILDMQPNRARIANVSTIPRVYAALLRAGISPSELSRHGTSGDSFIPERRLRRG